MKKLALVLALVFVFAPLGLAYFTPDSVPSIKIVPAASTAIASGAAAGSIKIINNAAAANLCSAVASASSGGALQVVCVSNGTNWVALT